MDNVSVMQECVLGEFIRDRTVIEGGHYSLAEEIDDVTIWTWEQAVALYRVACGKGFSNLGLAILVEDFVVPVADRQSFREAYRLPTPHLRALQEAGVDTREVEVVWEVQLRNRAHGDLRRRLKSRVIRREDGYYLPTALGDGRRITDGTTPVCNFLMARHLPTRTLATTVLLTSITISGSVKRVVE